MKSAEAVKIQPSLPGDRNVKLSFHWRSCPACEGRSTGLVRCLHDRDALSLNLLHREKVWSKAFQCAGGWAPLKSARLLENAQKPCSEAGWGLSTSPLRCPCPRGVYVYKLGGGVSAGVETPPLSASPIVLPAGGLTQFILPFFFFFPPYFK